MTESSIQEAGNTVVTIDLLALDLSQCGRCTTTEAHLEEAIALATDVLKHTGRRVELTKRVVPKADWAAIGMVSSPTVLVDGQDIADELLASHCQDCTELCDCDGEFQCRDWVWAGKRYTKPPVGLLLDGILRRALEPTTPMAESCCAPSCCG